MRLRRPLIVVGRGDFDVIDVNATGRQVLKNQVFGGVRSFAQRMFTTKGVGAKFRRGGGPFRRTPGCLT